MESSACVILNICISGVWLRSTSKCKKKRGLRTSGLYIGGIFEDVLNPGRHNFLIMKREVMTGFDARHPSSLVSIWAQKRGGPNGPKIWASPGKPNAYEV